jgi:hypothetical protein
MPADCVSSRFSRFPKSTGRCQILTSIVSRYRASIDAGSERVRLASRHEYAKAERERRE